MVEPKFKFVDQIYLITKDEKDKDIQIKGGGDKKGKNRGKGCQVSAKAQIIGKTKIFEEERCLYKVHGSTKKHVYYKREYIPLTEFKEIRKKMIKRK